MLRPQILSLIVRDNGCCAPVAYETVSDSIRNPTLFLERDGYTSLPLHSQGRECLISGETA